MFKLSDYSGDEAQKIFLAEQSERFRREYAAAEAARNALRLQGQQLMAPASAQQPQAFPASAQSDKSAQKTWLLEKSSSPSNGGIIQTKQQQAPQGQDSQPMQELKQEISGDINKINSAITSIALAAKNLMKTAGSAMAKAVSESSSAKQSGLTGYAYVPEPRKSSELTGEEEEQESESSTYGTVARACSSTRSDTYAYQEADLNSDSAPRQGKGYSRIPQTDYQSYQNSDSFSDQGSPQTQLSLSAAEIPVHRQPTLSPIESKTRGRGYDEDELIAAIKKASEKGGSTTYNLGASSGLTNQSKSSRNMASGQTSKELASASDSHMPLNGTSNFFKQQPNAETLGQASAKAPAAVTVQSVSQAQPRGESPPRESMDDSGLNSGLKGYQYNA